MKYKYIPHAPEDIEELMDHLAHMMFSGRKFEDPDFEGRDFDVAFQELNGSLSLLRSKLGEDRYSRLAELSARIEALYRADPDDTGEEAIQARTLIMQMEVVLGRRKPFD